MAIHVTKKYTVKELDDLGLPEQCIGGEVASDTFFTTGAGDMEKHSLVFHDPNDIPGTFWKVTYSVPNNRFYRSAWGPREEVTATLVCRKEKVVEYWVLTDWEVTQCAS